MIEGLRGILLDTNVLSELSEKEPDARVKSWFARYPVKTFWTTSISVGKSWRGITRLLDGKRKRRLLSWFAEWLLPTFGQRTAPFDLRAALAWADLANGFAKGRDFKSIAIDLQIAAISRTGNFLLATRNERDFDNLGLPLVNPWRQNAGGY